jgi:hypothetical protein
MQLSEAKKRHSTIADCLQHFLNNDAKEWQPKTSQDWGRSLETAQILLLAVLLNRIQENRARAQMQVTMDYHTFPRHTVEARCYEAQTCMKSKQIRGQIDINGLKTCTMDAQRRKAKIYSPRSSHVFSL